MPLRQISCSNLYYIQFAPFWSLKYLVNIFLFVLVLFFECQKKKTNTVESLITLLSTMSQWPLVSGGPCRELFFFISYLFTIFQYFFKNLSSTAPKTLVFTVLWLQKLHLYVRKKEPNNFKLNHRGQLSATRNFIEWYG